MKIRFNLVIISAILLIVIFMATAKGFVPYSKDTLFSKQFKYEGMTNIADSASKFVSTPLLTEKKSVEKDGKEKVEGFQGLQTSPYSDFTPIDRLGQLQSTTKCEQSIFSTSTGFVCLDDETKKLLASRGGNAKTGEAEIGK